MVIATSDKLLIGIEIAAEPSNDTPAIALAVCNFVAVPAFPVIVVTEVKYPAEA